MPVPLTNGRGTGQRGRSCLSGRPGVRTNSCVPFVRFAAPRRVVAHGVVIALAAGLALAGCTDGGGPAPTGSGSVPVSPGAPSTAPRETWTGSVDALAACLAGQSIPVSLVDLGKEGKKMVFNPAKFVVNRAPGGVQQISYVDGSEEAHQADIDGYLSVAGPVLVIDGTDQTGAYNTCLDQTDNPAPSAGPTAAADPNKAVNDASARWVACARKNGWADLPDPAAPSPGDLPVVLLPVTITPGQLDTLFSKCVPLDTSGKDPVFPNIGVAASDGSKAAEAARGALVDKINAAQAKALQEYNG